MKIGLASENSLPKAYASKTLDNGEQVTLQAGSEKLTISTNSFQAVANILSVFAPEGSPTLEPGTTFYIRDGFSDKETTVTANAMIDVAAALASFAVKPGKYIPAMKGEDAEQAGDETVSEQKPATKAKSRGRKAKTTDAEPVTAAAESKAQETVAEATPEKAERKKPGRKAAKKTEAASIAATPARKGRKAKEQAPEPTAKAETAPAAAQTTETAAAEAPAKRRGRPPKNRAVTDTADKAKTATAEKKTRAKKTPAPAETAKATPITRTPHSSGGPFPAAMTANHKSAEISGDVPGFIKELKAYYIIGDNEDYRFDFTALEMEPGKRRSVIGPAKNQTADSTFGYEVKTKAGEHIGWIIIEAENKFVMTGIPEMDVSSHRNIEGPITKTGIAIANKIATIRAKAA